MSDELKLYIDGQIFTGWETIEMNRNVDSISGQFSVSLFDRWRDSFSAWPIVPGKEVKVLIGNDRVLTGYIDDLEISFNYSQRSFSISGRDKSGDLVDCSAVPGEFLNLKADAIAKRLLSPFGIELVVDSEVDVGDKFSKWSIKCGESVFENLDRLGKQRGLFFISDEFGIVHIQTRGAKKSSSRLEQGVNIKSASSKYDNSARFSDYKVVGQSSGNDKNYGDETIKADASCQDNGITRYRPMIIVGDGSTSQSTAVQRAKWELATRIAKALTISVTVYGWRQSDGNLWKPNYLVDFNCPFLGINSELLISSVKFLKNESNGTTTEMELVRKESFLPEPTEVPKESDPVESLGW